MYTYKFLILNLFLKFYYYFFHLLKYYDDDDTLKISEQQIKTNKRWLNRPIRWRLPMRSVASYFESIKSAQFARWLMLPGCWLFLLLICISPILMELNYNMNAFLQQAKHPELINWLYILENKLIKHIKKHLNFECCKANVNKVNKLVDLNIWNSILNTLFH